MTRGFWSRCSIEEKPVTAGRRHSRLICRCHGRRARRYYPKHFIFFGENGSKLVALLERRTIICAFLISENLDEVLRLMGKYADIPMSFADACLVRMTEVHNDPVVITLDAHFRVYRRHGDKTIPCAMPQ